jgi:hypothetical protein
MNFTVPGARCACRPALRHAEEDGHVRIVPAGVHHADVLPVVGGAHFRRERQIDLFADRERVMSARSATTLPAYPFQQSDHAGVRDLLLHFHAEGAQLVATIFAVRTSRFPSSGFW